MKKLAVLTLVSIAFMTNGISAKSAKKREKCLNESRPYVEKCRAKAEKSKTYKQQNLDLCEENWQNRKRYCESL
jgi:hypothetical protein